MNNDESEADKLNRFFTGYTVQEQKQIQGETHIVSLSDLYILPQGVNCFSHCVQVPFYCSRLLVRTIPEQTADALWLMSFVIGRYSQLMREPGSFVSSAISEVPRELPRREDPKIKATGLEPVLLSEALREGSAFHKHLKGKVIYPGLVIAVKLANASGAPVHAFVALTGSVSDAKGEQ